MQMQMCKHYFPLYLKASMVMSSNCGASPANSSMEVLTVFRSSSGEESVFLLSAAMRRRMLIFIEVSSDLSGRHHRCSQFTFIHIVILQAFLRKYTISYASSKNIIKKLSSFVATVPQLDVQYLSNFKSLRVKDIKWYITAY